MKQFNMADRKGKSDPKPIPKSRPTDNAFDQWLNRGLHQLFDDVMNEPVPPELLKIVQEDQSKGPKKQGDSKK